MPTETEEPRTDFQQEQEEEGGPVKSFLEHLEDLRWVLIKTAAAVGVGMLICLIAGDKVVGIIMRPLHQAKVSHPGTNQVWTLMFGTNRVGTYPLTPSQQLSFAFPTNSRFLVFQLEPILSGTNWVLGFRLDPSQNGRDIA